MEKMIDQIEIFDIEHEEATNVFLHEILTNLRAEITDIKVGSGVILIHYKVPVSEMPTVEEEA